MDSLKETINSIILDPKYTDLLRIVKAARNGAVYGAKVRFPHALVMVFLFRSGTIKEKLLMVFKATRAHARNLAFFAIVYKFCMLGLKHARGKEHRYDNFFAGLAGGYFVFGRGGQNSVNQQIVIYVFARVMIGLAKLAITPSHEFSRREPLIPEQYREAVSKNAWPVFASFSWAFVMYLFRWYPDVIQPSLRSSMRYIYVDSDHWDSLRTLLLHNK